MENKLRDELTESRLEIASLKEKLASVMPKMHKDLSLISLVPKLSGSESSTPLEEFLASIESAARIGNGVKMIVGKLRFLDYKTQQRHFIIPI